MAKYTAFIDGASSGNPGDAGIGIVVYKDGEDIVRESKYIGKETNNVAEYTALLTLLEMLEHHGIKEIEVFSDSELMVKQLSGEYKVKNEGLKPLFMKALAHKKKIKYSVGHVRREKNTEADKLAKKGSERGKRLSDV